MGAGVSDHTLTLADVARLAKVQRPVVSMWRKRPVEGAPFPVAVDGRYRDSEIVEWLEQTGRGNNPEARMDVALHTLTPQVIASGAGDALGALIVLKAHTDQTLSALSHDEALDLADELDPDDTWLFSEVTGADYSALAPVADALGDAAWSITDAYQRLLDANDRRNPHASPVLAQEAVELLGDLVRVIDPEGNHELVDVRGSAAAIVTERLRHEELSDPPLRLVRDGSPASRAAARSYAIAGLLPSMVLVDGDWGVLNPAVLVRACLGSATECLNAADEAGLQLVPGQLALVIAPASALVESLGRLSRQRDELLRSGRVRVIARLPQGLVRHARREHLALWVLTGEPLRHSFVADLAGETLSTSTTQAFCADVAAACGSPKDFRARATRFLQITPVSTLVARSTSLVAPNAASSVPAQPTAADAAVEIGRTLDRLAEPITNPLVAAKPAVANPDADLLTVPLGVAVDRGWVQVKRGHRLEPLPAGHVPVWTPEAVRSGTTASVDLLALTEAHPELRLTQPGDVVFVTGPTAVARVDRNGGAAVVYPARALRLSPTAPVSPSVLAQAVMGAGTNSKWRTWSIPVTKTRAADAEPLFQALETWRGQLQTQLADLDKLEHLLTQAVFSGAVNLTLTTDQTHTRNKKGQ